MAAIKILIVVSTKLLRDSPTSYILVSFFGTSFIAAYHLAPKAWISGRPCSTIEKSNAGLRGGCSRMSAHERQRSVFEETRARVRHNL